MRSEHGLPTREHDHGDAGCVAWDCRVVRLAFVGGRWAMARRKGIPLLLAGRVDVIRAIGSGHVVVKLACAGVDEAGVPRLATVPRCVKRPASCTLRRPSATDATVLEARGCLSL